MPYFHDPYVQKTKHAKLIFIWKPLHIHIALKSTSGRINSACSDHEPPFTLQFQQILCKRVGDIEQIWCMHTGHDHHLA